MPADRDREVSLWQWLRGGLKAFPDRHHVRRVENQVSVGDPDVEGCIDGGAFNVELKVARQPRRDGSFRVELEKEQAWFAHKRSRVGGRSFVLVRVGAMPKAKHYLVPGHRAVEMFEAREALTEDRLRAWSLVEPDARPPIVWEAVALRPFTQV